jgi:hypothetical protein
MQNTTQPNAGGFQQDLPGASGAQVLGILSIIFCGLIGLILAIISLSKVHEAERLLQQNPGSYTSSSISKVRTGKVCSIISLGLLGLIILIAILVAVLGNM